MSDIIVTKLNWNVSANQHPIAWVESPWEPGLPTVRIEYLLERKKWLVEILGGVRREFLEGSIHEMETIKIASEGLLAATVVKFIKDLK
jgi:hypothetical protein